MSRRRVNRPLAAAFVSAALIGAAVVGAVGFGFAAAIVDDRPGPSATSTVAEERADELAAMSEPPTPAPPADNGTTHCNLLLEELERREAADLLDDEFVEEEELTEAEFEAMDVPVTPFVGSVGSHESPAMTFPAAFEPTTASNEDLVRAVDQCFEVGALVDEAPDDESEDE